MVTFTVRHRNMLFFNYRNIYICVCVFILDMCKYLQWSFFNIELNDMSGNFAYCVRDAHMNMRTLSICDCENMIMYMCVCVCRFVFMHVWVYVFCV